MSRVPLANPRSRIINFRLTESEYEQLQAACKSQGGRNISEYARISVLANAAPQALPLDQRLAGLDHRIAQLGARMKRLLQELNLNPALTEDEPEFACGSRPRSRFD